MYMQFQTNLYVVCLDLNNNFYACCRTTVQIQQISQNTFFDHKQTAEKNLKNYQFEKDFIYYTKEYM